MAQNIETRTEVAVKKYEGASNTVEQLAHTDETVETPVGPRKSLPKISREWNSESTRLQKEWGNESKVIREGWSNERNELSTKALGVKPWEAGQSETNVNQQRRWTDNHTYLPKTVPAVMDASGPNDDWIPYTANKSDTLNDVFGRKPIDLIDGVVITPDASKQYPKLNAFGKVWELEDSDQEITVKSFSETADEHLILILSDDSMIIAYKVTAANRKWVSDRITEISPNPWKPGELVRSSKDVRIFKRDGLLPVTLFAPQASDEYPVEMKDFPDSNWTSHAFNFSDLDDMVDNGHTSGVFDGGRAIVSGVKFSFSLVDEGEGISISNTQLFANSLKGYVVCGEEFGGVIVSGSSKVESSKIYLNWLKNSELYNSYLYFDAPDMPVSPVAYSDSYGGSVKDGIFAVTDRTGQDVRSFHGYRAGHKSVTLNACFFGAQAGEMAQDTVTDQWWKGGSAGFGRLALHDSTSANTAAMGNESANHLKGDRGAYVGSFSGNSAEGDDSCGVGFQSCDHNLGHYVNGVGYQSLYQNQGDYCDGLGFGALGNNKGARNAGIGAYVLNNSLGTDNFGAGYRTLSACHGSFNAAGGIQAAFKSDGSPFAASHVALWGYRAGYNSEGNGLSGVGREVLAGSTGDFLSGLGYLAGVGVTYSRSTCIGQQSTVTGNDQIQLGAPGTSVYAYGPVQDRSDERDKTDFNPISNALKNFFLDVEFKTYRLDYRESYVEYEQVQVGIDDEAQPVFETRIKPLPKDGSKAGKRHHAGAVAQQVKAAMDKHGVDFGGYQDHSVNGGEDVKSLGYQEFIPIIGALLQDHHKEIEILRNEIELLKKS
ncbi:TPA: tail fiber domain-containing protein [Vibrio alginolyticus]